MTKDEADELIGLIEGAGRELFPQSLGSLHPMSCDKMISGIVDVIRMYAKKPLVGEYETRVTHAGDSVMGSVIITLRTRESRGPFVGKVADIRLAHKRWIPASFALALSADELADVARNISVINEYINGVDCGK